MSILTSTSLEINNPLISPDMRVVRLLFPPLLCSV